PSSRCGGPPGIFQGCPSQDSLAPQPTSTRTRICRCPRPFVSHAGWRVTPFVSLQGKGGFFHYRNDRDVEFLIVSRWDSPFAVRSYAYRKKSPKLAPFM